MATIKINDQQKTMISNSIEVKIATIKRAMNTKAEPEFKELYNKQLLDYTALQAIINSAKD